MNKGKEPVEDLDAVGKQVITVARLLLSKIQNDLEDACTPGEHAALALDLQCRTDEVTDLRKSVKELTQVVEKLTSDNEQLKQRLRTVIVAYRKKADRFETVLCNATTFLEDLK